MTVDYESGSMYANPALVSSASPVDVQVTYRLVNNGDTDQMSGSWSWKLEDGSGNWGGDVLVDDNVPAGQTSDRSFWIYGSKLGGLAPNPYQIKLCDFNGYDVAAITLIINP